MILPTMLNFQEEEMPAEENKKEPLGWGRTSQSGIRRGRRQCFRKDDDASSVHCCLRIQSKEDKMEATGVHSCGCCP